MTDRSLVLAMTQGIIDRIEVDDEEVRIYGPKAALAAALANPEDKGAPGVPSFVREWWRTQSAANRSPFKFPV